MEIETWFVTNGMLKKEKFTAVEASASKATGGAVVDFVDGVESKTGRPVRNVLYGGLERAIFYLD